MSFIVYKHTNKTTGKYYVGWTSKSILKRWKKHVSDAKSGSKYHFHRAIAKYGIDDWTSETLETFETQADALTAEGSWIARLQSNNPEFGYNSSSGGEAAIPNEITRQRLSEAQRRRFQKPSERLKTSLGAQKRPPISEETRERLRKSKLGDRNPQLGHKGDASPRFGKQHSDKTKQKIAEKKRGQTLSDEARLKCSEASKKRWQRARTDIDQNTFEKEVSTTP